MRIQFLGATDTVTGSKYLVLQGSTRVLVDCGLFQGYKALRLRNWQPLPFDPARLDAVVLTHAHIDHSGYLPLLVRNGFRGPVYCSPATADLCRILLPDSAHLLEEEADFNNRHGTSKHHPALPLYTQQDAARALKLLKPLRWDRDAEIAHGLKAKLLFSGHMPGSSFVRLASAATSVLFSGDLGRPHDLVLDSPAPPMAADYLVVESTYGDREHGTTDVLEELATVVRRTAARGGAVIIPAFAVGRAQSLLHCLATLKGQGRIPASLPVFLNSPMAASAMQVFLRHRDELRLTPAECEAMTEVARIVETADESRRLNGQQGPMVVIAGSGMATGGRVVHHLKAFLPDHRNTILLAGFQAGGTRGAALAGGARSVRIHGEDIPVRAEVAMLGHLSAHADASEILDWLRAFPAPPRTTFITHGEPAAADALRQRIERELGWNCRLPYYTETVTL